MEKRYQVFISSTFEDLKEERNEVVQALLELDCIPCGMEYFPASNDTQWEFIKRLIDDCDYYIVIIGGRYGSIGVDGKSYTQMEYDYAISKGIPTIGFIHSNPESIPLSKSEKDPKKKRKLEDFKKLVQTKLCKLWASPKDLGGVVSRSMIQEIKINPRVGWIKANQVDANAEKTIVTLYKKIADLEQDLIESKSGSVDFSQLIDDSKKLSQGDDEFKIKFEFSFGPYSTKKPVAGQSIITWNKITYLTLPKLIGGIREATFKTTLNRAFKNYEFDGYKESTSNATVIIADECAETIKIQLLALGYINLVNEEGNHFTQIRKIKLTKLGEQLLIIQRAVKK